MTFQQLYELALSRAGDVSYFRGAPAPTIMPLAQVKIEVNSAYEDLVGVLGENHYFHVETYEDVAWPASQKELDLESALSSVPRELLYVGVYPSNAGSTDPYPVFTRGDGRTVVTGRGRNTRVGGFEASAYYLTGNVLGRNINRTAAETVHIGFAPLVETLTNTTDVPAQAPSDMHQYIAQRAAYMMVGGANGAPQFIATELARLYEQVARKATLKRSRLGKRVPGFGSRKL